MLFIIISVCLNIVLVFDSGMPRRSSFINRNDSVDSTTACSLGNQSLGNAAALGGASNFLGVPKSDSPGLLAVPTGHCGESTKFTPAIREKYTEFLKKKKFEFYM